MLKKVSSVFFLSFLLFFVFNIPKISFAEVVINEFSSSTSDDWVELYNNSDQAVDLSAYTLLDGSSSGNVKTFSCILYPKGFSLAGFGNDLNNGGDIIYLKKLETSVDCVAYGDGANKKCEGKVAVDLKKPEIDEFASRLVDDSSDWVITKSSTKEGPNDASPKNPDAICVNPTSTEVPNSIPTPTETVQPSETPTITPNDNTLPTPQSYSNIFLSEAMIDPESGGSEWIEIYNGNDFSVSLDNWFIDDVESGGTTAKKFSLTIPAKSYGVHELTTSIFNNDGDSVRLLDFAQSEKDSFQYQSTEKGKTLGRTSFDNDTFCLQNPSRGSANSSCLHPSATPTPKITPSSTLTPTRTPTLTPTKKVTPTRTPTKAKPKASPTKFSLFTQNKVNSTKKQDEVYQGNILGAETKEQSSAKSRNPLLTSLLFASFSFAILAIISIAIKTKIWKKGG